MCKNTLTQKAHKLLQHYIHPFYSKIIPSKRITKTRFHYSVKSIRLVFCCRRSQLDLIERKREGERQRVVLFRRLSVQTNTFFHKEEQKYGSERADAALFCTRNAKMVRCLLSDAHRFSNRNVFNSEIEERIKNSKSD